MKKEKQVILLPAGKDSKVNQIIKKVKPYIEHWRDSRCEVGTLGICKTLLTEKDAEFNIWQGQYLYVLSEENIKVGEWTIFDNSPIRYLGKISDTNIVLEYLNGNKIEIHKDNINSKILATNNSDLWINVFGGKENKSGQLEVAKIGLDFSERYVKQNNKGNPITSVMVEYEQLCHQTGIACGYPCNGEDNCKKSLFPKIRSNGTIIISPLEGFSAKDYMRNHADFTKYYDSTQKRNIWVLGYFGGGSVNITEAYLFAKEYAKATNVPIETVKIDEVLHSRRHKGFKFLYSQKEQTREIGAAEMENVYSWLTD